MRAHHYITLTLSLIAFPGVLFAQLPEDTTMSYRSVATVAPLSIVVPTVVEVPVEGVSLERKEILVVELGTDRLTGARLMETYIANPTVVSPYVYGGIGNPFTLTDGSARTGLTFDLPVQGNGTAVISLTTPTPILSSSLLFTLDRNVALPTAIEVRASSAGEPERIIVAQSRMMSERVNFLPTRASSWTITLTYAQPLRIQELTLAQDGVDSQVTRSVRFLAQPGLSYEVYVNPDSAVNVQVPETGNLSDDTGVFRIPAPAFVGNSRHLPSDGDSDGVPDKYDNCVAESNADQRDLDASGRGDACEDFDRDGYANTKDNCPDYPNGNQLDEDGDGIGDVCDGEESRVTERLPWVPWVGMGLAALILVGLFAFVAMRPMKHEVGGEQNNIPPTVG